MVSAAEYYATHTLIPVPTWFQTRSFQKNSHLTQTTIEGLNQANPAYQTVISAIGISKALGTVLRHLLI